MRLDRPLWIDGGDDAVLDLEDVARLKGVVVCGNCDIIYEAFDLFQNKGLPTAQVYTEVSFQEGCS